MKKTALLALGLKQAKSSRLDIQAQIPPFFRSLAGFVDGADVAQFNIVQRQFPHELTLSIH